MSSVEEDIKWSREDVQRVLYHVIRLYEQANSPQHTEYDEKNKAKNRKMPRRFIFFGRRLPFLGGDSELLRDAIYKTAIPTLKDNNWWPEDDRT